MESYDILVIILSVTLAVFLILGIWALILTVQVLKKIKEVSENARHAAENVEEFTEQMKKAGRATAAGSLFAQVANAFKGRKK